VLRDSLWALSEHVEVKKNEFLDLTVFPLDAARLHNLCYVAFSNALAREVMQTVQIPWLIILCNYCCYTRGTAIKQFCHNYYLTY
jgi:hypothetical protein